MIACSMLQNIQTQQLWQTLPTQQMHDWTTDCYTKTDVHTILTTGIRKCNPDVRVFKYFPKRSITKACFSGTILWGNKNNQICWLVGWTVGLKAPQGMATCGSRREKGAEFIAHQCQLHRQTPWYLVELNEYPARQSYEEKATCRIQCVLCMQIDDDHRHWKWRREAFLKYEGWLWLFKWELLDRPK